MCLFTQRYESTTALQIEKERPHTLHTLLITIGVTFWAFKAREADQSSGATFPSVTCILYNVQQTHYELAQPSFIYIFSISIPLIIISAHATCNLTSYV